MISIPGVLTVKVVAGRYGDFRVGRLTTTIGIFAVKNALLDQYSEGNYEGVFGVSRIYPTNYSAGGRLVIEVRADVQTIALSNINPLTQYDDSLEQDPIEESGNSLPTSSIAPSKPETATEGDFPKQTLDVFENDTEALNSQSALAVPETMDDEGLFGLLWPLKDQVKLDATVSRNIFRQQRDRLMALGYIFKPIGQFWVKP
ncbi:MAG: DUF3275 family protein [Methylococcales bacterium]